jgi:hypothetical protein
LRNEGRDATLELLTHDGSKFDLNVGAVMVGHAHWQLVP